MISLLISLAKARLLFRPLFDTVALLNAHGIVHRGISPDTILVAGDGYASLKGRVYRRGPCDQFGG